jgi:hypothetical protein
LDMSKPNISWNRPKYKVRFFNKSQKLIVTNPPVATMELAIKMGEEQLAYSRKIGDTEYHSYRVIKIS